ENLVRFASITVSRYRAAGRAGGGCVMGSENLKGIAVRGTRGIQPADPKGFMEMIADLHERLNRNVRARDGYRLFGTLLATGYYQRIGVNAYRNNQHSLLPEEKYQKLSHRSYSTKMEDGALSCSAGCVSPCGGWHRVKGDESVAAHDHAGSLGSKPEYLGIASFGVVCDIPDMAAVTHLSERCNDYGMDLVEMGGICGFLLELWQRGLIGPQDAQEWFGEPVALEWGDHKAVEKIIDVIALHKGKLGDLFQAGLYKGAQRLEEEKNISALQYALYGKGGAVFTEDIRHTPSWALNMAVASRGSDHLKGHGTLDKMNRADISQHYFGTPDGAKPFDITLKGAGSAKAEVRCGIINSLGLCIHLVSDDPILYPHELFCRALETAIGLKLTPDELEAVGRRV
ncbi:MAG: aldehyde ferredoxin oxidoreductase C-terminal domain-containing protein, partial [Chloroflexota bacterium]|nr:aldehyde ferredoxin oxidoreductase C-terminal domain-containing protein [Chloroflexota bacterium]